MSGLAADIIGIIGSFHVFTQVFVLVDSGGGPLQAGLVYMMNVYNNAFRYFRKGYAAALSVILFLINMVFTLMMYQIMCISNSKNTLQSEVVVLVQVPGTSTGTCTSTSTRYL